MATQQYSLRWNNFHSNLSSGFHELFEAAEMVDVTLAVDGKFLQAHKIVLSICSPYFKQMFKVTPCKHPIVILKDVGHDNMKDILEFMYMGEVSVLRENLTTFLRTAELLQVKGLTGDDSSDTPSKKDDKTDCDNEVVEEPEMMPFNQLGDPTHLRLPAHYSTPRIPSPPVAPLANVPNTNTKRFLKHPYTNFTGKRSKTDNNANQSPPNKTTVKQDEPELKKPVDSESEYTDISNIKSDNSLADEETLESLRNMIEKTPATPGAADSFADNGKPEAKYNAKPTYACEKCPKKFSRRDHLRTHEKNIHGEDAGPFACIVCSQLYKNTESLRKHIAKFHLVTQTETPTVNPIRNNFTCA